jgi:DNA mismatch repair protein MutS
MAGKSTFIRQVAIITLMAHLGAFVPARAAHIGLVDRVFTRVGATDYLARGQSTFLVEMTETANILHHATDRSLVILDEIGRGTSTFDGMAIARAVLEHVCDRKRIGAKTLFATHYHELTVLENRIRGVKNYNIAAKKRGKEIIFLRKIVPGGADDSYGVEVARLAGVPDKVITRADELLRELEAEAAVPAFSGEAAGTIQEQVSLVDLGASEILNALRKLDPNTLTPIEALGLLYTLKKKAEN